MAGPEPLARQGASGEQALEGRKGLVESRLAMPLYLS